MVAILKCEVTTGSASLCFRMIHHYLALTVLVSGASMVRSSPARFPVCPVLRARAAVPNVWFITASLIVQTRPNHYIQAKISTSPIPCEVTVLLMIMVCKKLAIMA
jgi:hypothetical protein